MDKTFVHIADIIPMINYLQFKITNAQIALIIVSFVYQDH